MPTTQPSQAQAGLIGLIQGLAQGAEKQREYQQQAALQQQLKEMYMNAMLGRAQIGAGAREYAADQMLTGRESGGKYYQDPNTGEWKLKPQPVPAGRSGVRGGSFNYSKYAPEAVKAAQAEVFAGMKPYPQMQDWTPEQVTNLNAAINNKMQAAARGANATLPVSMGNYYTQTQPPTAGGLFGIGSKPGSVTINPAWGQSLSGLGGAGSTAIPAKAKVAATTQDNTQAPAAGNFDPASYY